MVEPSAAVVVQLHDGSDVVLRDDACGADVGLVDALWIGWHVRRAVNLDFLAGLREDAVGHVRSGDEEIEIELALEALADDVHVQEPEEATAEAEAQRLRSLGLVEEGSVVELELFERIAQLRVVVRLGRIET